jgi:hypothetical protein
MPHPDDEFDDRPPRARRIDDEADEDDDDLDRPSRRRPRNRRRDEFEPTELIVPTGVSAYSIVACYAGLIGMCLPGIGLVFAIPAFICAIIALRKRKQAATYGAVTSDIRAIAGLIMSSIGLLVGFALVIPFLIHLIGK